MNLLEKGTALRKDLEARGVKLSPDACDEALFNGNGIIGQELECEGCQYQNECNGRREGMI